MHASRLAAIAAVSLFTLAACGKDEATSAVTESGNTLLSYVPAGSPYLGGNLERIPREVVDSFLEKLEPMTTTLQGELEQARVSLQTSPEAMSMRNSLLLAVLQELDGKLNRQGLETLGLDLQANEVFYGMGAFPVARVGLGNATLLNATVQRILKQAGIIDSTFEFEGRSYWKLADHDTTGEHADFPAAVYVAILDDHIAFSVFPTSAERDLLPLFLGIQKPAQSDAKLRLQDLTRKYGYTLHFAGLVDLQLLADEFLNPESIFSKSVGAEISAELSSVSEQCRTEFREIIAQTPRLVMGSTELETNAIGLQYGVETQPEIASQLMQLVAELPLPDPLSNRLLEFSLGIKVGATREFLREKALAITQDPFQCEHLQKLNENAVESLAQLNQPMPPLVNNFRGLRLSLKKLHMDQLIPDSVEGLLAIHVDQPEMFVGMAQMFLPDLSSLNLVKGNPPVQLPAGLLPIPDMVAFAALSDDAIGLSVGVDEEKELMPFLDRKAVKSGSLISLDYDTAAYMDFSRSMGQAGGAHEGSEGQGATRKVAESLRQSYKDIVNRSQLTVRFTENGLIIDSRMTFK